MPPITPDDLKGHGVRFGRFEKSTILTQQYYGRRSPEQSKDWKRKFAPPASGYYGIWDGLRTSVTSQKEHRQSTAAEVAINTKTLSCILRTSGSHFGAVVDRHAKNAPVCESPEEESTPAGQTPRGRPKSQRHEPQHIRGLLKLRNGLKNSKPENL